VFVGAAGKGRADERTVAATALAATGPRTMRITVILLLVGIFLVLDVIVLILYRLTHRR
jgi:hypothetical protein